MPKKEQSTASRLFAKFLGTRGDEDEDIPSSINSRISSGEEMRTLVLHDFLGKKGVENSKKYHDSLAEHGISKQGLGRKEVVEAIRSVPGITTGDLPKSKEMSSE